MTKQRLHTATIVLGVITAVMVVLSQVVFFDNSHYGVKVAKTEKQEQKKKEQDDKKGSAQTYLTISTSTQQTTAQVEPMAHSSVLFEILFESHEQPSDAPQRIISFGKFFQTLFRVIISPNAP